MQKVWPVGRESAQAAITRLTSAAAAGRGGALVITGAPGDGRTTLLRWAARRRDWAVLRGSGYEDERDLPHDGLRTLLAGIGDPSSLPGSTPCRTSTGANGPDAFLAHLRTISRARPVLCLVDDAHLLDRESWRTLVHTARRIGGDRVAMVLSCPAGAEPAGIPAHRLAPLSTEASLALLTARCPDLAGDVAATLAELAAGHPGALTGLAGALTPEQRRGFAPPPETLPPDSPPHRRLVAELDALPARTRHLLQLAAAAPDTSPSTLLAAAARIPPAAQPARTPPRRALSERAREKAEPDDASAPGVESSGEPENPGGGAGQFGGGLGDLAPAEQTGLVSVTVRGVVFRSELARGVAYRQMGLARRRIVHLALAAVLDRDGERDRALSHRAAAATGPDPRLARDLAEVAAGADPLTAAEARQRAADLVTGASERADLLVAAARDFWLAGRPHRAGPLIRRIPAAPGYARVRARALIAEMSLPEGRPGARDVLLDVAAELAESDPGTALEALALAGESAGLSGERERYAALARRVVAAAGSGGPHRSAGSSGPGGPNGLGGSACPGGSAATALISHHVAGLAAIADGDEPGAFARLREAVSLADRVAAPGPLLRAAVAGILIGDGRRAAALAGRATVLARERGAGVLVPQALELAALAGLASGDYAAANEAALDGAAAARSTGQPALAGTHLAVLSVLAALVGDRDSTVRRIALVGDGPARPLCEWALALLDLVDGRHPPAAERLLAVVTGPPGPGSALLRIAVVPHLLEAANPTGVKTASAREAATRAAMTAACDLETTFPVGVPVSRRLLGRTAGAVTIARVAAAFDVWAGWTGQPGWLALRDRCRALRSDHNEEAAGHFQAALGHDGEAGFPRAHTELLYGRMLRRERRHVRARAHLRRAAETFRALDAGPWAAQSLRELRAAGERTGSAGATRSATGPERVSALTAQQERIATLVAGGATNREVAQELHLSPRTVDHHLRNVFTRLGVRSRTEMARLMTDG
ncbi:LuxR C-terminal-related transcriptional regulator [Actinoplanes sp. G11-F43]|uniref:helix-turn-helix transcriptional regulator n=1 Tax=Actinoplanes sp. G11-F43 TaxID=3424130 RepID=UPI003D32644F